MPNFFATTLLLHSLLIPEYRSIGRRKIKKQHVFFGREDANSYAENFVNTLRGHGWLVASVNAHDVKKQRTNLQASTDRLDLMGIATVLLSRRANWAPAQSDTFGNDGNLGYYNDLLCCGLNWWQYPAPIFADAGRS